MKKASKILLCNNGNPWLTIGNAVFWAAAILIVSRFSIAADGNNMTATGILIAFWFACHTTLQSLPK